MSEKERIEELLHHFRMSATDFAEKAGFSAGIIADIRREKQHISKNICGKIIKAFPEVSKEWLLEGEGGMIKKQYSNNENDTYGYSVPILPVYAQAGSIDEFSVSVKENECERVIVPIKGADLVIPISGNSMEPEYHSGSQILIKKINERAFIDWGKVYVLDTCNGSVIKRIFPSDDPNKFKCVSINPEYPPFEVSCDDIIGVYRVLMCMSIK